ncbi:MAG TPA: tetratricopeptide repeat protein [Verrucomicrobiales bacterium]|nr:tetratricopeptide repeat protein [Verrucomicrobiales bacterium]
MGPRPVIFVSAVTQELKSARDLVAKALLRLGYEADWEDLFGIGQGDIRQILREKIDRSAGVIQLIGRRYGTDTPEPHTPFGRVSYTQFEAHYARQQGKKVWYLVIGDTYPADPTTPEPAELTELQRTYRERVASESYLYHPIANPDALLAAALDLRDELAPLRKRWNRWAALVLALLVLSAGLGVWMVKEQAHIEHIATDPHALRARLEEKIDQTFEQKRQSLLAAKAPPPEIDALYRWRDRAEGQVAEAVAFITARAADPGSPIITRAAAILEERGVDATLEFLDDTLKARRQRRKEEGRQLAEASLMKAGLYESQWETSEQERALRDAIADAPDWWLPHNQLGLMLHARAQWAAAEQEFEAARQVLPAEAETTLLNNLAQLYKATNRLAEAEPLMERALKIDEKSFGPEHPDVAIRLNNLATLYQVTNRLAEAEPLMERALKIDEKSFGPEHPEVAIDLNNLAQLYKDTNRLAEAEPLMDRALKIDEKSFGPEHPNVAIRLNNLAQLYQATNRLAEAEPRMRRSVVIFLKVFRKTGHPHPDLDSVLSNYALILTEMSVTEAEIRQRLTGAAREAGVSPEGVAALRKRLNQ